MAGDVGEDETAAALKKQLAGRPFQTVNQASQKSISEQAREVVLGAGAAGEGVDEVVVG